jgi:hypothetical protein
VRIDELRLDELTGYRENPVYHLFQQSTNLDNFATRLKVAGYDVKMLGKGVFGMVFTKPGSQDVYKVFTSKDQGYLDFLKYAKANQSNPHVPKIRGGLMRVKMPLNNASFQNKEFFIVRMENLQPLNNDQYPSVQDMRDYTLNLERVGRYDADLNRRPVDPDEVAEWKAHNKTLEEKFPQLAEVLNWIYENEEPSRDKSIDLHRGNIMQRGPVKVIIDPFSYFGD